MISGTIPPHITHFNDIGDVNVPAPVHGYFVYWDAIVGKWQCQHVVTTVDHLNDIGDVNVPAPTDQYFIYWDATAGRWQCRALIDADIPASIARDAEVAAAIAAHAGLATVHQDAPAIAAALIAVHSALTTGIHGVGASTVDSVAARNTAIAVHAALTAAGIHGSTVAATFNRLVHRDAAGRAKIVNPAVNADIDNMGSRDAAILVETLARALADAMHAAITTPPIHGSTVAATFDKLIHRDGAGRAQIVNPAVNADIDNLGARIAAIAAHTALADAHHTEDHHAEHEHGGADEPNLDDLEGQPWETFNLEGRSMNEWWKSMDSWTQVSANGGFDTNAVMRLEMQTSAANGGRVCRHTEACRSAPQTDGQRGFCTIWLSGGVADCEIRFYITHKDESFNPLIDTEEHGGIKIINGDIFASVGDGAAEEAEDTGVNFTGGKIEVEIRGIGTAMELYVNGVMVADLDGNLPTTHLSNYCYAIEVKNTAAVNKKMRVNYIRHRD